MKSSNTRKEIIQTLQARGRLDLAKAFVKATSSKKPTKTTAAPAIYFKLNETLGLVVEEWLSSLSPHINKNTKGMLAVGKGRAAKSVGYGDGGAIYDIIGTGGFSDITGEIHVGYDFEDQKLYILASTSGGPSGATDERGSPKLPISKATAESAGKAIGAVLTKLNKSSGLPG